MKLIDVERLVRQGAGSLAESLHFYWPAAGNNELAERNISLHLGHALLRAGFLAFAEAHPDGATDRRLDLLALHPREEVLVACECKRLYHADKARELGQDAARLLGFQPQSRLPLRHQGLNLTAHFGVLAATTWSPEYAQWFTTDDPAVDPTGGVLDALGKQLPGTTLWDAYTLMHFHDPARGQPRTQWLVYAVFPIGSPG